MTGPVTFDDKDSWAVKMARGFVQLLKGYFIVVGVMTSFVMFLVFLLMIGATTSLDAGGTRAAVKIESDSPKALKIRFDGALAQAAPDPTEQFWSALLGDKPPIYVPEFRAAIRRAEADPAVAGLEIELHSLQGSMAEIVELREVIRGFRDSGKPVRVYMSDASSWNYFLASAADEIIISPATSLFLPGPVFTLVYFSEALKKVGVDFDILRVGKYKSAIEPFVRMEPSEEAVEQYESMERALRDFLVQVVAQDRGADPGEVQRWFRESIFTATAAVEEGLVDGIGYLDTEVSSSQITLPVDQIKYEQYKLADRSQFDAEMHSGTEGLALIEAVGEIVMSSDKIDDQAITPENMRKRLDWAKNKAEIKAVVLRIASPGGSAVASDMIWQDVKELAAVKPVVVSMGASAASGGYYIAAPATHIVAEPTTITGSIGVFGMVPNVAAFEEKYGVAFHVITQTERAAFVNPGTPATSFDRTMVEVTLDQIYQLFLRKVGEGRDMTTDQVDDIGQGRVYTGIEALQIGLVDSLGGLQAAFSEAKKLGGLNPDKLYAVYDYQPERLTLSECIVRPDQWDKCLVAPGVRLVQSRMVEQAPFGEIVGHAKRWMTKLQHGEAMALWPGYWSTELSAGDRVSAQAIEGM